MAEQTYENLGTLLQKDEAAHAYYLSLPYDAIEAAIRHKDDIHTLSDLKTLIALYESRNKCCGDL